jgi:hypothetical protein
LRHDIADAEIPGEITANLMLGRVIIHAQGAPTLAVKGGQILIGSAESIDLRA